MTFFAIPRPVTRCHIGALKSQLNSGQVRRLKFRELSQKLSAESKDLLRSISFPSG